MNSIDQMFPNLNLGAKSNKIDNSAVTDVCDSIVKAYNSAFNASSGMGGCGDFGTGNHTIPDNGLNFIDGFDHRSLRKLERLYYTDWGAQRIVDIPIDDALREPFEFKGLDEDESKKVNDYLTRVDFYKKLEKAMKMERLYGGSALFIGTNEANPADPSNPPDLSIPIDYNAISENDLLYFNPVNRISITNTHMETDPTMPGFCDPSNYTMHGKTIATNRLMLFDGAPLCRVGGVGYQYASMDGRGNDGFGYPILLRIAPDLARATGARQAAFHLIQRASMMVFIGDIQTSAAFRNSTSNLTALKQVLNSMSNYQAALINSSPDSQADVKTLSANFSSIPELMREFDTKAAGAAGIPITRWLGESPKGMQSSGEGEMENYNNMVRAIQRHRLAPQITKRLLPILLPSAGINKKAEDVEIIFPALWQMTDLEEAQIRTADTANVTSMVLANLITPEEGQQELLTRDTINIEPAEPALLDFDDGDPDGDTGK